MLLWILEDFSYVPGNFRFVIYHPSLPSHNYNPRTPSHSSEYSSQSRSIVTTRNFVRKIPGYNHKTLLTWPADRCSMMMRL